jgi:hypothetical protein
MGNRTITIRAVLVDAAVDDDDSIDETQDGEAAELPRDDKGPRRPLLHHPKRARGFGPLPPRRPPPPPLPRKIVRRNL